MIPRCRMSLRNTGGFTRQAHATQRVEREGKIQNTQKERRVGYVHSLTAYCSRQPATLPACTVIEDNLIIHPAHPSMARELENKSRWHSMVKCCACDERCILAYAKLPLGHLALLVCRYHGVRILEPPQRVHVFHLTHNRCGTHDTNTKKRMGRTPGVRFVSCVVMVVECGVYSEVGRYLGSARNEVTERRCDL